MSKEEPKKTPENVVKMCSSKVQPKKHKRDIFKMCCASSKCEHINNEEIDPPRVKTEIFKMSSSPSMVEDQCAKTPRLTRQRSESNDRCSKRLRLTRSPDPTGTKDEDPSKLPAICTALLSLEPNEKNHLNIGVYQVTATFTITKTENKTGDDNDNNIEDNKDSKTSLKTSPPSSDVNVSYGQTLAANCLKAGLMPNKCNERYHQSKSTMNMIIKQAALAGFYYRTRQPQPEC